MRPIDLSGTRVGRWTVIVRVPATPGLIPRWRCVCECGKTRDVDASALRMGRTRSCGCSRVKHGASNSGPHHYAFVAWKGMIQRCHTISARNYADYGARGISVCDAWRADFLVFLADVGERPSRRHSLDRKDNDGNYEPGNVRWATRKEQSRNTRTNVRLTVGGVTSTIAEWGERTGIRANTIVARLRKGWGDEASVTTPLLGHSRGGGR